MEAQKCHSVCTIQAVTVHKHLVLPQNQMNCVKTILLTKFSFLTAQCCTVYFTVYYCINAVNLLATHQKHKLLATHFVNVSFGTNYNKKTKHNEKRETREYNLIIFQHYQISTSITP